ncbi:hypothetical protein Q2328_25220, partial [Escherichia coli]|nr:hypothetical protein [Escherichia coli]
SQLPGHCPDWKKSAFLTLILPVKTILSMSVEKRLLLVRVSNSEPERKKPNLIELPPIKLSFSVPVVHQFPRLVA